jgi:hypothetical protein
MKKFKIDPSHYIDLEEKKHSKENKQKTTGDTIHSEWRRRRIKSIKHIWPKADSVVCVGARSDAEVNDFINYGFICEGVDVCTQTKLITKLDAHYLSSKFNENQFDIAYSCHSLEHMYNPELAMQEIRKVSSIGAVVTLPVCRNDEEKIPDDCHPVIYDIMLKCPPKMTINNITPKLLNDFKSFGEFKIVKFFRSSSYSEIDIYFEWL